jgi:hypothetical protein
VQLVLLLRFTGVCPRVGRNSLRIGLAISSSTSVEYSSAVDSSAVSSAESPINDSSVETSIVSSLFWIPEVEGKGWTSIDVAADGLSRSIEGSGLGVLDLEVLDLGVLGFAVGDSGVLGPGVPTPMNPMLRAQLLAGL